MYIYTYLHLWRLRKKNIYLHTKNVFNAAESPLSKSDRENLLNDADFVVFPRPEYKSLSRAFQ